VKRVVVLPAVSHTLGQFLQSRAALIQVLARLHDQLANHSDIYRHRRDQGDPDLFDDVHSLYVGARWCTLRFSVNDSRATDYLFVEAVACR
jgi:hypothetical protein